MVKVPFGCFGDVWVDVSKIPKISAWNLGHLKVPRLCSKHLQDLFPLLRLLLPGMARSRSSSHGTFRRMDFMFGGVDHERGAYGLKVR